VKRILDNGVKILPVFGGDVSSSSSSSSRINNNINNNNNNNKLSNLKVCITGTFTSKSRSEIQRDIERLGGSVSNALAKSTDILLIGENPGKSKLEKAREIAKSKGGRIVLVEGFEQFQKDWLTTMEEDRDDDDDREE
jgi:NAD-dependent DNA ligase